jgi:hypothetical protein
VRTFVGLWINQREAIVVSVTGDATRTLRITSGAKGRSAKKGKQHLRPYYREVTDAVRDAQSIFIFGSVTAKMALKEALLNSGLPPHRVVGTELAERMTEQQLVRATRKFCGLWARGSERSSERPASDLSPQ